MDNVKISKEYIHETITSFIDKYEDKELIVAVMLNNKERTNIAEFRIASAFRDIYEVSNGTELVIAEFDQPMLLPGNVTIPYADVRDVIHEVRTGENDDDVIAEMVRISFANGIVLELGFACV